MDKEVLLNGRSRITTLSNPPPIPSKSTIKFDLPPQITIVHLTPPDSQPHQLVSITYDITLFNRVKEYFNRFYAPTNTSHVVLNSVDVILNQKLEEQFKNTDNLFSNQLTGLQEMEVCKSTCLHMDL